MAIVNRSRSSRISSSILRVAIGSSGEHGSSINNTSGSVAIARFANGGQPEVYIGSADLMERNLDRRVEALCRVRESVLADHIRTVALDAYLRDTERSYVLTADRYDVASPNGGPPLNAQQHLLEWYTTPPPDDDVVARP